MNECYILQLNNIKENTIVDYTSLKNIDEISAYIENNTISSFNVISDDTIGISESNSEELNTYFKKLEEEFKCKLRIVDKEHPFFVDNKNNVYMLKSFYDDNRKKLIEAYEKNCCKFYNAKINKFTYDEELIKKLVLRGFPIILDYNVILSKELEAFLISNHAVCFYSGKNGIKIVSDNHVLGTTYNEVLSESDHIILNPDLIDYENLSIIPNNKQISFKFKNYPTKEELNHLSEIIILVRLNGNTEPIRIFMQEIATDVIMNSNFASLINKNIIISDYMDNKLLDDIIKEEKLLDLMIQDIKISNYSPLEKYIAVYNIVKKFKGYKEDENNLSNSRTISKILYNDYMVCLGYARLLNNLMSRVGLSSYILSLEKEAKDKEFEGHARLILNIDDEKYNIHGYYLSDPTWDNNLKQDYYNYVLMDFDKIKKENKFNPTLEEVLLNIDNIDEFFINIEQYIMQKIDKRNPYSYYEILDEIIEKIYDLLEKLDINYYYYLKNKYSLDISQKNHESFLTETGNYFVLKKGKKVSLENILSCALKINKDIFDMNDEDTKDYYEYLEYFNNKREKEIESNFKI